MSNKSILPVTHSILDEHQSIVSKIPSYNFIAENVREKMTITPASKTTITSDEPFQNDHAALVNDVEEIKLVIVWSKTDNWINSQVISNFNASYEALHYVLSRPKGNFGKLSWIKLRSSTTGKKQAEYMTMQMYNSYRVQKEKYFEHLNHPGRLKHEYIIDFCFSMRT